MGLNTTIYHEILKKYFATSMRTNLRGTYPIYRDEAEAGIVYVADLLTQMRSGKAGSLRQLLRTHSFFSSLSQRPPPGRAYSVTRRYGYTDPRRLQALVKQAVVANPDAFRAPA